MLDIVFKRSLAKHELKNRLYNTNLREELECYRNIKKKKNGEDTSAYVHVPRGISNKLDTYKKEYKDRYGKRKGLGKLDCYYENKIFKKIDSICELTNQMNNKNKSSKKNILGKYVICFILFALLPFLGLILPILLVGEQNAPSILPLTTAVCQKSGTGDTCDKNLIHVSEDTFNAILNLNWIISYSLLIVVVFTIVYTFIKVIKYEKFKANKGKMGVKEYCLFCKDVFNNKIS
ncbi:hypothetical protein PVIIG_05991 [Plasmodium vivax India VII]|uniref:Variable surface protein Vir35 n=1 Tax=Plasmodium vivax India VII TaxID=1077284 RepID=A0A0J9S8U8_PLAVI|nr:hypothetical protein PVIIG_05991 [Plasmodium vivax India VII]